MVKLNRRDNFLELKTQSILRRISYRMIEGRFSGRCSVLLTGSPRSGTTWISEVFSRQPGILVANEPLHPGSEHATRAGFTWRTFKEADAHWPTGADYIDHIASGRLLTPQMLIDNTPIGILKSRRVFLKCVRANRIMPWLLKATNLSCFIIVIRNPYSVISSQMKHSEFEAVDKVSDYDLEYISQHRPDLIEWVRNLSGEPASRALTWAIDQVATQAAWGHPNVKLLHYEHLIRDPANSFAELFDFCSVTPASDLEATVKKPSREAQSWSTVGNWSEDFDPIAASGLEPQDIDAVSEVIDKLGLNQLVSELR